MDAHRRRRWIVVGCLIVVVAVVGLTILFVFPLWNTGVSGCYALQCGPSFSAGNPSSATLCTGIDTPIVGCLAANDYYYVLTIEESSLTFGEVLFKVVNSTGSAYYATPDGGFNILNASGQTVAAFNLNAGGPLVVPSAANWTYFPSTTGVSAQSTLNVSFTIVIDMGSVDPAYSGYDFVALGTGSASIISAGLALP